MHCTASYTSARSNATGFETDIIIDSIWYFVDMLGHCVVVIITFSS